ncbi:MULTISPECIES: hypothetical protein [Paraburkholderia]|uniref:Uncharacterized protein n=1 Tax=Paraburkholderia madseniana TaxID=2599607 RepID=A0A6N6WLS4_9BURK|nr:MULTISPECIES: hypothetical protein [Paraburkholderia]KAE8761595.1 hypothetical protein FSO04_01490 [Paraburkholderia madseniana]MCX4170460.1 hypothetical protein [Paraburkholderia madseniana]MDQ6458472.1 hypothetical protein [Paraburkholderia madseniana]NPT67470.1 hypothetical protein [Paraburkholderia madseniana]
MTFRTAALAVATASVALFTAASQLSVNAQTPPDSQWRASPITLSTLLQDGYKIVAVVNGAHGNAGSADTIFVQRDQSAFKCIDPSPADAKTKAACFELVQPSGAAPESK